MVGIFPNEASILRLIGAVLMEQHDDWLQANRYMPLHAMSEVSGSTEISPPAVLQS